MILIRPARPEDLPAIEALLSASGLPLQGVREALPGFLAAEEDGRVVGAIAVEEYGEMGLLRSAVVDADRRGDGVGAALTSALVGRCRQRGCRALFLLTTTAEGYFAGHGFRPVARAEVPEPVRRSVEFLEACPASAVAMRLDL